LAGFLFDDVNGFASLKTLSMEVIMQSFGRVALAGAALLAASAALPVAFSSPAHAIPYTASCSGGGSTLTCTFVSAAPGELFVDSQAADVNLSGSVTNVTESFTFNGVTSTNSSIELNSNNPVDGLGHFTVVDNLLTSPPRADTITLTITGTSLATAPNESGNIFAAHIGTGCIGVDCTSTFFTTPTPVPAPVVGAGLPGLVMACAGLIGLARRRRKLVV
jgi:hypothetical protein